MDIRLLTDTIVRQTTVLLAQIATAAGIRAPLAHVANQVFLDLAQELEGQGVRRKVVADMFGLALRSYQIKMRRLLDSSELQHSNWQCVFERLEANSLTRTELTKAFPNISHRDLAALLNDLVDSGLVYCSGSGLRALYGATSEADRMRLSRSEERESLANMLWLLLSTGGDKTEEQLRQSLSRDSKYFEEALTSLITSGRVVKHLRSGQPLLEALTFHIPVGAEQGWEAAVGDHYGAVATALAAKLANTQSRQDDRIGGATLRFSVHAQHPMQREVRGLLQRVRQDVGELWERVSEHNRAHPLPAETEKITFYFGQNVLTQNNETIEADLKASDLGDLA